MKRAVLFLFDVVAAVGAYLQTGFVAGRMIERGSPLPNAILQPDGNNTRLTRTTSNSYGRLGVMN